MSEQTQRIQEIKARADAVSEYGHLSLSSDQNGEYYYIDRDSNHDYTNPMVETNSVDAARFILGAFIDIPWLLDQLEAAKQEQADPQPLTCEGCKHEAEQLMNMCSFCTRIRSDRYEPKGDHHD